ncbi:oxidoreductase, FAD-binding [Acidisarcina polymorpha]|uniref:Oxidoreductase, FAD-binding n=1 Tax=Acidisarcina polymorpha TaxID=2211140 RepID=A0A2Z5FX72_9BACT|nr:NAD(P)/FAD-dependent oxidoreductase [Acidisarcina polymorpha]AXC11478.1 oxidoreductase, FAD-binding [Acidisarcina polymorpha]
MKDVVIIGAGLAGLHCALTLERAGLDVLLLEASDIPGGRVLTDAIDGFLLDRGFQVLLTAYPEAERVFDYSALDLKALRPGALVWHGGRFHRFADPFREPFAALRLAFDPVVTLGDKLRVGGLRQRVTQGHSADLFSGEETTTQGRLENFGFSSKIIERFFRPFFGGVFSERELVTSSRYFDFLFRMFSQGSVAVPSAGMQALPAQLARQIKPGGLLTNCLVKEVRQEAQGFSALASDGRYQAERIVIAVPKSQGGDLLPALKKTGRLDGRWNRTTTFYFSASQAPVSEAILVLNGEGEQAGPVNNAVVMSNVSASYAPPKRHLISASVVGQSPTDQAETDRLEHDVRAHLQVWFGTEVRDWQVLRCYSIPQAVPLQKTAEWETGDPRTSVPGVYRAGDILETASIQGALASGRRAAEAVLADMGLAKQTLSE